MVGLQRSGLRLDRAPVTRAQPGALLATPPIAASAVGGRHDSQEGTR
ncbi:hypothetical protein [Nocardioides sp. GXQ0305]